MIRASHGPPRSRESEVDVLVAGVGFVGSYVVAELAAAGLRTCGVDVGANGLAAHLSGDSEVDFRQCDLSRLDAITRMLADARPKTLVLTARLEGDGDFLASERLVKTAAEAGATKVILISSLAVYGGISHSGSIDETAQLSSTSAYGRSKLEEERTIAEAANRAGVSCLVLRVTGMFGRLPAPRPNARSGGAIDRLIRQYLARAKPVLTIENTADQYLYARELGVIVARAALDPPPEALMNVGPGCALRPSELHSVVEDALRTRVDMNLVPITGRPIGLLATERLDDWFPERKAPRSDVALGIRSTLADFRMGAS